MRSTSCVACTCISRSACWSKKVSQTSAETPRTAQVSVVRQSDPRHLLTMRLLPLRRRNMSAHRQALIDMLKRSRRMPRLLRPLALPPPNNYRRMLRWRQQDSLLFGRRLSHAVISLTPPEYFSDSLSELRLRPLLIRHSDHHSRYMYVQS